MPIETTAADIIIQWSNVQVEDGPLLDVVRGKPDRAATELAAHLAEPVDSELVQRLAGEIARKA